jgi:hypothetical protein
MYYISDVDYFDELTNNIHGDERADNLNIDTFVGDYTSLVKGQTSNYLDGSVVQFIVSNPQGQLYFNALGGKKGNGSIEFTSNITFETNRNFTLRWDISRSGYILSPAGNTNVYMVVNTKENALYGKSTSGGNDKNEEDAIFVIQNAGIKDNLLHIALNVQTPSNGTYGMYLNNGFLSPSKDIQPTEFKIQFVEIGKEGWKILINKNQNVGAYCCFPTFQLSAYTNFTDACNETGFTETSNACKGAVPSACQNLIQDGFGNLLCQQWCKTTGNEKLCYNNVTNWCKNSKNANKPVCACFNQEKFDKYKNEFYQNCPKENCKVSDFTAGCYFDECLQSGMQSIARQGNACPDQTSVWQKCIQNLDLENSNVNAKDIVLKCQLRADQQDVDKPVDPPPDDIGKPSLGSTTRPLGGTTQPFLGTTQQPPLLGTTPPPPPPVENSTPSFFEQYKWYIIGGGVGIVVILILIAVAFAVNKSGQSI